MKSFVDEFVSRKHRYSLGNDQKTGSLYISIPVTNRLVDYEEYYHVDPSTYDRFLADEHAAATFADECRKRHHDDQLIFTPGSDRGTAI